MRSRYSNLQSVRPSKRLVTAKRGPNRQDFAA
jgi:hypothetical protein